MAVTSSAPDSRSPADSPKENRSRSKCPRVRVVGGRIYDSDRGTTCHQCRQKTLDFAVQCRQKKKEKACSIKYCHKCLMNRYGENAEEVSLLDAWECPRCRGLCNCSFCMKKRGQQPTGILVRTAKENGFSSVLELLNVKGSENFCYKRNAKDVVAASPTWSGVDSPIKPGKDNSMDEKIDVSSNPQITTGTSMELHETNKKFKRPKVSENGGKMTKKLKKSTESCDIINHVTELLGEKIEEDIPLPIGTSLITVAGIELPNEVAGEALQFIEFCAAFGQAFEFEKGQAEAVIRDIVLDQKGLRLQASLLVQFHIKLLSLILEDLGERSPTLSAEDDQNSWLKLLHKCVSNCNFLLVELPSDSFDGNERYVMLNALQKFKLLNFLCDEVLSTNNLRNWIDDQNLKFAQRKKEAKEKLVAAKDKKKQLKKKVQDEVAKMIMDNNGATLSLSEHEEIVSKIKAEAALAQAELLETMEMMSSKRSERCDALRIDPLFLDDNGRAFWRLKGYKDEPDILLQDMGRWDCVPVEDKWFVYNAEQKDGIDKYISYSRSRRVRAKKVATVPLLGDIETDSQYEST